MATNAVADKIVLKMPKMKEKTQGGIFLPEQHLERKRIAAKVGKVVSMGKEAAKNEDGIKVGTYVYITKYSGAEVFVGDTTYRLIYLEDVFATVDEEDLDIEYEKLEDE